jgi:2-oxoglutarate ferredoxin oxidoreductase subunit alpha
MQEGLSYIAGSEVPCVVVEVMRGGPGLGNIHPAQSDYFQITRSAGHGDYRPIVLAPASVQEAIDFTGLAFDLAEKYRHITILAADGLIGQMMEPAELPPMRPLNKGGKDRPPWALTGAKDRPKNVISSIYLQPNEEEAFNLGIQSRLRQIRHDEQRWVEHATDDAALLVVAFGTAGRIAFTAAEAAREKGLHVGLFRPQTLWPFPEDRLAELAAHVRHILVVEMNAGQMIEDVRLAVNGRVPVSFFGRMGGVIPMPEEVLTAIEREYQRSVVRNGASEGISIC